MLDLFANADPICEIGKAIQPQFDQIAGELPGSVTPLLKEIFGDDCPDDARNASKLQRLNQMGTHRASLCRQTRSRTFYRDFSRFDELPEFRILLQRLVFGDRQVRTV